MGSVWERVRATEREASQRTQKHLTWALTKSRSLYVCVFFFVYSSFVAFILNAFPQKKLKSNTNTYTMKSPFEKCDSLRASLQLSQGSNHLESGRGEYSHTKQTEWQKKEVVGGARSCSYKHSSQLQLKWKSQTLSTQNAVNVNRWRWRQRRLNFH